MGQTSMQYTPVQVLQAARRAEAEGKMDYALQFYRHLVEQHGATAEAQEAREGLFRIAEWRWGEARIARRQDAPGGQEAHFPHPTAPSPPPPPNVGEPAAAAAFAGGAAHLPQLVARNAAPGDDLMPPFKTRYRFARLIALAVSGLGCVGAFAGIVVVALGWSGGGIAEISAVGSFGLPIGLIIGVPLTLLGLVLIVAGQLAVAVFESSNATLEMLAIERGRLIF